MNKYLLNIILCTLVLSACQPKKSEPIAQVEPASTVSAPNPEHTRLEIKPQTTQWLAQGYERLLARHNNALIETERMAQVLSDVCDKKTSLQNTQKQWLTTYQAWLSASAVAVGPETLGAQLRHIYFRPARANLIEQAISTRAHSDAQAAEKVGAAAKGMTAMEYLLFDKTKVTAEPQRCAYAKWLGGELLATAQHINQDMRGFIEQQNKLLQKNDKPASEVSVNLWVNSLISRATELAGKDLTKIAVSKPEAVSSPYAGKGKVLFNTQLQVWQEENTAFAAYLESIQHADLAQKLRVASSNVAVSVKSIPDNFAPLAGKSLPVSITHSITAIQETQSVLESEIAPTIGVTISANDADGD